MMKMTITTMDEMMIFAFLQDEDFSKLGLVDNEDHESKKPTDKVSKFYEPTKRRALRRKNTAHKKSRIRKTITGTMHGQLPKNVTRSYGVWSHKERVASNEIMRRKSKQDERKAMTKLNKKYIGNVETNMLKENSA